MNLQKIFRFVVILTISLVVFPAAVSAHEPHDCPDGFPETPGLQGHTSQADIANGSLRFGEIFTAGKKLFMTLFNHCDGQGRPATTGTGEKRQPDEPAFIRTSSPDSSSCGGCHNQPRAGGGGDFVANVFVLAQALDPVLESVSPNFSNERNTLGMFGAGPIEMVGREMTADLQSIREAALQEAIDFRTPVTAHLASKGVDFGAITVYPDGTIDYSGLEGVDPDLIIKPFHQAGVVRSIREFTANAMNHHHGMQAEERFDLNSEKEPDFDQDGVANELTVGDITAVTIFQAALGIPGQVLPRDPAERSTILYGEQIFAQIGCSSCHVPEMTLESRYFNEPNPLNPRGTFNDTSQSFSFDMTREGEGPFLERTLGGTAIVRAYTDLKRHDLCDDPDHPDPIRFFCNEQLAQNRPDQQDKPGEEYFLTRKLWDVGSSAPYGHRGDLTTITEAILFHAGEARGSMEAFTLLSSEDQAAIIKFLKTLQILPPGSRKVIYESPQTRGFRLSALSPIVFVGLAVLVITWRRYSSSASKTRSACLTTST